MTGQRTARLRKKLHIDEFTESGFEFRFACPGETEFELLADLSAEVLSHRQMAFVYEDTGRVFISGRGGSLTEDDRTSVESWIRSRPSRSSSQVGPLINAWHPPRGVRTFSARRRTTLCVISPAEA